MVVGKKRIRGIVSCGLLSFTMLAPALASAQEAGKPAPAQEGAGKANIEQRMKNLEEAKSRYSQGLKLYDDGAFEAARVQFERAYELAPSYKILYNIGLVYKQLNDFVGALKALQGYLAEGQTEVPEARRAEVTKLIEELKGIVASAVVTVNEPGAEVAIDDLPVGKSPLSDPVLLNPGKRKISVKMEGRLPDAKVITVASGDVAKVELKLVEPPKTTVIKSGTNLAPIIAWSVTGALAVGAGITGYLTTRAQKGLDDERDRAGTTPRTLDDKQSQLKTAALVTDILAASTVVAAGVSVYFTWFRKDKDTEVPSSVKVGFSPTGVSLGGTF